jgi:hypothetical protein
LAIKLSDVKISGVDQSQSVIEEIKAEINKQSLIDFADPNAIMTRYPPDMFMQRSYTYVPGEDAYKEVRISFVFIYSRFNPNFCLVYE